MSTITAGVDVGSSAVKVAVVRSGDQPEILATHVERLHRRDPVKVVETAVRDALEAAGVTRREVAYLASTGEGDVVQDRDGHFFGMTTHARGAIHLLPEARTVMDVGALHARVLVIDGRGKVIRSRMTSQCASGTGQFLENIARYLGVRIDEVGALSQAAERAESVSGICAVLAETDVINMVSRGIATGEILRGIHDSIGHRLVKLLRLVQAVPPVMVTGGMAADTGLHEAILRKVEEEKIHLDVRTDPLSVHAGAIGAAIWGAFRHRRLSENAPASAPLRSAQA